MSASTTTAAPLVTPAPPQAPEVIYQNPSGTPFLLFVVLNAILFVVLAIVIVYLVKQSRDFSHRMNALRRDKIRRVEKASDRMILDFNHSPEDGDIAPLGGGLANSGSGAFQLEPGEDDGLVSQRPPGERNPLAGKPSALRRDNASSKVDMAGF
jgi:hypothetical protein